MIGKMSELRFVSHSEHENYPIAAKILKACGNARIFAFYGQLGAGKTTLIKSFCKVLEISDTVTSPTFTLVNEYEGENAVAYHFDFYRILSEAEAFDLGYEEYFFSGHFCFVEWPEKISSLLPSDTVEIRIEIHADNSRIITVHY
jgi:tRNA threonylcarbamoyladenosine biosynthesis protein TsaE